MLFSSILGPTITLFLLILVGFVIRKRNIITDDLIKGFSNFVLNVTMPIFIIVSMDKEFSKDRMIYSAIILFISVITYFMKDILSRLFTRILKIKDPQSGVYRFLIVFSNSGFMGIPVVHALYGDEGAFYAAVLNITFNIFIWTLGVGLVSKDNNEKSGIIKRLLLTPGITSVIIGMILFLTPLSIPSFVHDSMDMIGSMNTPLAMIVIGGILGGTELGNVFTNKNLILVTLVRLLVVPLILIFTMLPFKLPEMIVGITLIIDTMPAAATTAIFARRYESDYELASQGVFITTLLNLVTIPFILYIFSIIYKF